MKPTRYKEDVQMNIFDFMGKEANRTLERGTMNRLNIELKPGTIITINDDHSIFIKRKNEKHSSRKQVDESIENIKEYIINKYKHQFELQEIRQGKLEAVRVL